MPDRVAVAGCPMLYVTTCCSTRPSSMASEIKAALTTVRALLAGRGMKPLGPPIVTYDNWDGRLVTIEAGYPVAEADAAAADGRVLAGRTPAGVAVTTVHKGSPSTLGAARAQLDAEVLKEGNRVTGLTWERYLDGDGTGPASATALYVMLEASVSKPANTSPI
jgi:effector-binding domain-containing protein